MSNARRTQSRALFRLALFSLRPERLAPDEARPWSPTPKRWVFAGRDCRPVYARRQWSKRC
jgi:hypothetical protein